MSKITDDSGNSLSHLFFQPPKKDFRQQHIDAIQKEYEHGIITEEERRAKLAKVMSAEREGRTLSDLSANG